MVLRVSASTLSPLLFSSESSLAPPSSLSLSSSSSLHVKKARGGAAVAMAAAGGAGNMAVTGVVFEPFKEVKSYLDLVPASSEHSLARYKYEDVCEAAINEQINVEYSVSYIYHAMFAYFDRDNVALKGMAKFFKESSEEEREHAEKLMEYQNIRGGRVVLKSLLMPLTEYDDMDKGDALHAMQLTLSLEKMVYEKLLQLHDVAVKSNDPQLAEFVEREYLGEQVDAIKKIAEYVSQLRRVGKGHGVWHFDRELLEEGDAA